MKDRILQGMIAGIIGWLPQFIFTMIMYFGFHLVELRYLDFAGILAFNHKPQGVWESIFAESIVIGQMGGLGILFVLIIEVISSKNLLLKSGLYGGFTWFTIYLIAELFQVKGIYGVVDFKTSISNVIAAVIWGIALGGAFLLLKSKTKPARIN